MTKKTTKHPLGAFLEHCDQAPLRMAMVRVEAATYTDADGNKWIDGKKLFGGEVAR